MDKEQLNTLIGERLKTIRVNKGLSLDQVSELTGVSKPMLGQIERAQSNPTVSTLWKIAEGLKVPFSTFIEEKSESIKIVKEIDITPINEDDERFSVYPLFPTEDGKPFEIFNVKVMPGCSYSSNPHPNGVEEYLWVTEGTLALTCHHQTRILNQSEGIRFRADTRHRYENLTKHMTSLVMIIYYP
ncbi:XRE family transcriptional regulator [Pullulanibacillus sp. KACC 23026]|uniref:helix-turn-helix domain-containing protein n=1 Tax=Pullulanibacillus sp. KACC 23026 TaxID=3028315 RepID=UPI0023B08380|nr:XRE family transcriptional regulator [Pullulanibacillus sp. KACC 23026]WEG12003.1 XRE family transcriptional regulator [Pullulanibacillus sp. KACC 23026]